MAQSLESVRYPVLLASGYLLMSVMTLGYSAVWVNGSIFYTWTFTAGVWAMMPLADLVFDTGAVFEQAIDLCASMQCHCSDVDRADGSSFTRI